MATQNHNEYTNTPYPIANTDGLYRVLVPTGGTLKNGYESYYDYLTSKGQAIPQELLDFLGDRYGDRTSRESAESQTYEYAYRIYRKPEDMSEKDFVKAVKSELSKPGEIIRAQAPSPFAVCEDLFDPTKGNFVSADENGFLLVNKMYTNMRQYNAQGGNVLINGRRLPEGREDGETIDSMEVIDLSGNGFIRPADENGYYPVDMFYRKGSDPRVRGIHHNFISPTGEFVCQDASGELANITEESEVVTRYIPTSPLYTAPYVVTLPGKRPILLPTASQMLDRFPALADDATRRAAQTELESLDAKTEHYGYLYDEGRLTDTEYQKAMAVLGNAYDNVAGCVLNKE